MSTTIKSAGPETPLTIRDSTGVGVCIDIGDGWKGGYFTRADFLAAVETECNVRIVPADSIVIERGELPEIEVTEGHYRLPGTSWPKSLAHKSAAAIRSDAMDGLALAEYLDANPPVDEAQVAEILSIVQTNVSANVNRVAAVQMYLAGVRVRIKAAK